MKPKMRWEKTDYAILKQLGIKGDFYRLYYGDTYLFTMKWDDAFMLQGKKFPPAPTKRIEAT